jgi:hypothetical protein
MIKKQFLAAKTLPMLTLCLTCLLCFASPASIEACQREEMVIRQQEEKVAEANAMAKEAVAAAHQAEDAAAHDHEHADADETESHATANDDQPLTDTATQTPKTSIGDQFIRFHMWDGSIIGGEVTVGNIDVETEFGTLQIPINRILKFHPGLDSIPSLKQKISQLVEGLGDKNFDIRESSHRDLLGMGLQLRNEIHRFDDGGSAERKKHLEEIKKQIGELADELDEIENDTVERSLIRGDLIVTSEFSIVGKIKQENFQMASKFGELSVRLGDIKMADRSFNDPKSELRKTVEVGAMAFFQTKPVSTRIRVNRGDRISIRASGTVNWTNWNKTSGPDGIDDQGQWQGFNCGTLLARIGNGTDYIKIGDKGDFTAKKSGVLFLGIANRDNYASNSGYKWNGEYDAKITVKPAN